jgi:hypothetical protein
MYFKLKCFSQPEIFCLSDLVHSDRRRAPITVPGQRWRTGHMFGGLVGGDDVQQGT